MLSGLSEKFSVTYQGLCKAVNERVQRLVRYGRENPKEALSLFAIGFAAGAAFTIIRQLDEIQKVKEGLADELGVEFVPYNQQRVWKNIDSHLNRDDYDSFRNCCERAISKCKQESVRYFGKYVNPCFDALPFNMSKSAHYDFEIMWRATFLATIDCIER